MEINMRLTTTKGGSPFMEEMMPRYPVRSNGSCFTSAHRQGLTMARMKRKAHIFPELMGTATSKERALSRIRALVDAKRHVRGRTLYKLFVKFGCYRPHSEEVFGPLVKKMTQRVLDDEWIMFEHPEKARHKFVGANLLAVAHVAGGGELPQYGDIETCIDVLTTWNEGAGRHERFHGEFNQYFALHDKKRLAQLRQSWGNFSLIFQLRTQGKDPEHISTFSLYHPQTQPKAQLSILYQPIG